MSSPVRLTAEDRALLRKAYVEGPLKVLEPDPSTGCARKLEKAGLLRSVPGETEEGGVYRFFALSGAGVAQIG